MTDHLGNVRATITADPADLTQRTAKVIQENSYYPFGMVMPGADLAFVSGDKNNYLYNGKELQEELGQYDYGARFYDPAIGRWNVPDPLAENHYDLSPYHYVMGNPMLYIDPLGLDTAQVYGYIYNGDGLFKAQSAYEFLKNKAKRDSDFSEAFNSINSNGSNKRPLTPEELLAKRKAEEDRLRRIEYDAKRHNYGMKTALDKLDLAGKISDATSGLLEGAHYKHYLGTIKPSAAYGFKVYSKSLLTATKNSSLIKGSGSLGLTISAATVVSTWADEGHFGNKTKISLMKATTSTVAASTGAKIGATVGGIAGSFVPFIGTAAGALAGGVGGAYIGGLSGGWIVDKIYE
ncbi:RHS repeat domain-containing protein [Sphingobacterium sp. UDSM-2020]|uniref:RHS repeat domain-containing protein n=1 Tax=Sphingobacterium sp. UDSM-2020 TaxID=2795738 RepID=UPI001E4170FC|nr:RHS repeat-associated core domain-containing protein [Sphingobacterium sp. UDSM-2020]